MQGGRLVYDEFELFHGVVLDYPTYDKELFVILQVVKKWKNYLLGKYTTIHTDHQPLQYLQRQSKMQRHYKWLEFLQQFRLLIRYKKDLQKIYLA
jgi:hypothetical protein